jgi:hypothetical protein
MSGNIPEGIVTTGGYGTRRIAKSKADYFWGDKVSPVIKDWNPKAVLPQLETLIDVFSGTKIAIAGGAVLASLDAVEYNDIDVFPLTPRDVNIAETNLSNLGYKLTNKQEHFLLYERTGSSARPVQIILIHIDCDGDVQRLLNRFDLSVCQVAVYNGCLHSNTNAIQDIKGKVLRVERTMNITSLIHRVMKYNGRGYSVLDGEEKIERENTNTSSAG